MSCKSLLLWSCLSEIWFWLNSCICYWCCDLLRFCMLAGAFTESASDGLPNPRMESCVDGVWFVPLKKGAWRMSLALPRFCAEILSMFLTAKSASSPIPGKYFWRFFLEYSLKVISRFSASRYPSLHWSFFGVPSIWNILSIWSSSQVPGKRGC